MRILSLALPLALAVSSVAAGPISFGGALERTTPPHF
jgi:hypothetical protein